MIQELFLPEKTKTRRLIAQRIVGISVEENMVSAAQIYATSTITNIEQLREEQIPPGAPDRHAERVGQTINKIISELPKYDQIRIVISSSIVTFKELTLPFTDIEKIRMVVEYEVEPMLPFSMNEAIVDFIITNQNKEEQTSQILVAAIRKQELQPIFDIYQEAEVDPDAITVDLFALYGLYLQTPEYKNLPTASAIINIDTTSTNIAFLLNGQMRLIRNISKGINTIAEHISKDTNKPITEIMKNLVDFGTQKHDDPQYNQAAQKYLSTFLNDIQFTLNSFSLKLNFYEEISKLLVAGKGSQIKNLTDFASTLLQTPCENFSCNKLFKTKFFKNKTKQVATNWTRYALALGSAIPYAPHDEFNLRKKNFAKTNFPLANKQIIVAALITLTIFASISIRGFLQISNLKALVLQKERSAIAQLKKVFPPGSSSLRKNHLTTLMKDATREIERYQEAWTPFLQENLKPLEILQDLTQTIDKRLFSITTEKISLSSDEQGAPIVEVAGIFKSKPGESFADYQKFLTFFEQNSKLLSIKEHDEDLAEDGGVKFILKFKLKEKSL
ncbi:pilus assembly protein PilM [Candidatus Dependentiae bacterium]|nr:pilus assembly protein PilM [Candidatus Dependentiae bacterium]